MWTAARPSIVVPPTPLKLKDASKESPSKSSISLPVVSSKEEALGERRGLLLSLEDVERVQSYVRSTLVKQVWARPWQQVVDAALSAG